MIISLSPQEVYIEGGQELVCWNSLETSSFPGSVQKVGTILFCISQSSPIIGTYLTVGAPVPAFQIPYTSPGPRVALLMARVQCGAYLTVWYWEDSLLSTTNPG